MRDTCNPYADDIREWAYDPKAMEPEQDWDLIISHLPYDELFVELAADNDCPKWDYFMSLIYLIAGDAVRTNYVSESRDRVGRLISCTERIPRHRFHVFRSRYKDLCDAPETFCYDDWCAGGWVAKDKKEAEQGASSDAITSASQKPL
ncbi:hypothetical protein NT6N_24710 [Oceaniferula spumae]|uniref:Uncharacterized protein n=1 Tax=Oceaniferula spumae TaxID=2979115 RepID=A0AAT9FN63_9BACT